MRMTPLKALLLLLAFTAGSGLAAPIVPPKSEPSRSFLSRFRPAPPAKPVPRLIRITGKEIAEHRPGQSVRTLTAGLEKTFWTPTKGWLRREGKKYGVLLIASDTHPGPGRDALTGKMNRAEDFLSKQEADMRAMLKSEHLESTGYMGPAGTWMKGDGQVRTLVLNGDVFEFMQTTTAATGSEFKGPKDAYGPLNTPRTIVEKLKSIYAGHPDLFEAYAQHLVNGHRIVLINGNHDKQLLDPNVRRTLKAILFTEVSKLLAHQPGSQVATIRKEAMKILDGQYEFHPNFFLHGDVYARHWNDHTDWQNSFSGLYGNHFLDRAQAKAGRDKPMEAALGDYFVKSVFNQIEKDIPWGDNTAKRKAIFFGMLAKAWKDKNVRPFLNIPRAIAYALTREGHGTPAELEALKAADRAGIVRDVNERGLVDQFNELRQGQEPLTEAQVVDKLLRFEEMKATPFLSLFKKGDGVAKRLATLVRKWSQIRKIASDKGYERRALAFLGEELGIKTVAVGHDHVFRDERYVYGAEGRERLIRILDDATWTNSADEDVAKAKAEKRGVIKIRFDERGSHSELRNWDSARGLIPPDIYESEREAKGQE